MASKGGLWGHGVTEKEGGYVSVQRKGIRRVMASRRQLLSTNLAASSRAIRSRRAGQLVRSSTRSRTVSTSYAEGRLPRTCDRCLTTSSRAEGSIIGASQVQDGLKTPWPGSRTEQSVRSACPRTTGAEVVR